MTRREAAIVSAYTGYLVGEFSDLHVYINEILGRPVFTHQLPDVKDEIIEKSRADFVAITVTDGSP